MHDGSDLIRVKLVIIHPTYPPQQSPKKNRNRAIPRLTDSFEVVQNNMDEYMIRIDSRVRPERPFLMLYIIFCDLGWADEKKKKRKKKTKQRRKRYTL
jgi:hypothetical protein